MSALHRITHELLNPIVGYQKPTAVAAAEPTALATLLLLALDKKDEAAVGLDWLRGQQQPDGAVAVTADTTEPRWPTGLALLAFARASQFGLSESRWESAARLAKDWILNHRGEPIELRGDQRATYGHDTTLVAWPWVIGTHSWIEPTCLHVLALNASGEADHPRANEARRLLRDRLLRSGGCNYGNTTVLGQQLRPHLQPSGMTAVALAPLAGESTQYLGPTLDYLQREAAKTRAAASLAWSQLGLAAHDRPVLHERLEQVAEEALTRGRSPYRLAMLGHAMLGTRSPLLANRSGVAPATTQRELTTHE